MNNFSRFVVKAKPVLLKNSILCMKANIFKDQKLSIITIASFPKVHDGQKFVAEPYLVRSIRFCSSKPTDAVSSSSITMTSTLKEISSTTSTEMLKPTENKAMSSEKTMLSSSEIISSPLNLNSPLDVSITSNAALIDNKIPKILSHNKIADPLISSSKEPISSTESIHPDAELNSLVAPSKPDVANSESPKKQDIEKAIFRVVAHFWDYGKNAYVWSRGVLREHVLDDPSVKYYWKRFHDKMQESKKGF